MPVSLNYFIDSIQTITNGGQCSYRRSIQTEGHFGDIKENDNFRRFNCRTAEKVYKEFMLYAIVRNINKYPVSYTHLDVYKRQP